LEQLARLWKAFRERVLDRFGARLPNTVECSNVRARDVSGASLVSVFPFSLFYFAGVRILVVSFTSEPVWRGNIQADPSGPIRKILARDFCGRLFKRLFRQRLSGCCLAFLGGQLQE